MKTYTGYIQETVQRFNPLAWHDTINKLIDIGLNKKAAEEIVKAVFDSSSNRFNGHGDPYPDMSVVVYPKNNVSKARGFIVYELKTSQTRFKKVYDAIMAILSREIKTNIKNQQVQTGYSFTW